MTTMPSSPTIGWAGEPTIRGGSQLARMLLLTAVAIGIQFTWRVEMAYCTPYLLELGLGKSGTALVWLAGPFSGMVTQPVIGVLSDASTSRWGRRRPFMLAGSVVVAASFLALGFARTIVGAIVADPALVKRVTVALAVLAIWSIDLSVNAIMSCARSLVVDVLPAEQQQLGGLWYNRMSATADVLGNSLGAVNLVSMFGTTFGNTQFKQITVLAAVTVILTTAITCWAVSERVLVPATRRHHPSSSTRLTVLHHLGRAVVRIVSTMRNLPPRIRTICHVQFFAWLGWFPFLYYSSTWVGELYFQYDAPGSSPNVGDDVLGEMGRVGSLALTWYAIMAFVGAWFGPMLIQSPEGDDFAFDSPESYRKPYEAGNYDDGDSNNNRDDERGDERDDGWLSFLRRKWSKPDLLAAWVAGNLGFTATMVFAPFAKSFAAATVIVAGCGVPWTIHNWAPGTFLGIEVNRLSAAGAGATNLLARQGPDGDRDPDVELESLYHHHHHDHHNQHDSHHQVHSHDQPQQDLELSGIYFGILNIYVTVPQVIANMMCYVVFAVLEPAAAATSSASHKGAAAGVNATHMAAMMARGAPDEGGLVVARPDGPNAIGICFFIGALCTMMAARTTTRLRRQHPDGTLS